jgi:uncharacterized protein (TIGR02284 family)
MDNQDVISTLNGLIETCRNGEEGFRTAADHVKDAEVKELFRGYAEQRAEMVRELQKEVRAQGGDPEHAGTVGGAAHRGWMNLKAAVASGDESVIAEAERGEDIAKRAYEEALNAGLPPTTLALVREQSTRVRAAHDRVRALEKASERK